jgi:hypothetical protein
MPANYNIKMSIREESSIKLPKNASDSVLRRPEKLSA